MTNIRQLQCIKNTLATINNYTNYCVEIKQTFDKKDEYLIKDLYLQINNKQKITGTKYIHNKGKTNKAILDYINNMCNVLKDFGLVNYSN